MDTLRVVTSDPVARFLAERGAKVDRKNRMRLMKSSEILDTALRIYQRMGLTFLRFTAVPALLCLASLGFVDNFVLPNLFTTSGNGSAGQVMGEFAFSVGLAVFVGGPLFLLGVSYTSALVVQLVSEYMLGHAPAPEEAASVASRLLPKLFVLNLRELVLSISGILASTAIIGLSGYIAKTSPDSDSTAGIVAVVGGLGVFAGAIIFLFIIASDALAVPVAVLERISAKDAAKRSRNLLKRVGYHPSGTGNIWSLYFLLLFLALILAAGLYAFIGIFDLRDHFSNLVSSVPGHPLLVQAFDLFPPFVIIWTLLPVWASVITIVYYERKIRLEGFDIDVLASEIPVDRR